MGIPDFQAIMLPLLKQIQDGKEYKLDTIVDLMARKFKITDEERKELLPSGQTFVFGSRVGWARTYMKKAGLIDTPKRGYMKITNRGLNVLKENPIVINVPYLKQFPQFLEWQSIKKEDTQTGLEIGTTQSESINRQTPEELLDYSYSQLREGLAIELIEKIKECSPSFFERLVIDLLIKMGYGGSRQEAGRVVGKSGDGGIDGIINEDKLGLDSIYIQAKRWEDSVGRPEIQKFIGALAGQGAKKGIFITTSCFTKDANEYLPKNDTKIVLIDGRRLAELMIEYGVGVATKINYEIKRMDIDYFEE
ncbi:MAG: restriction endonuclease [Bacteroidales bacterium]|jgi:restriction system protein|nr:restriction endonuclease [Bacteroidales bacterium]